MKNRVVTAANRMAARWAGTCEGDEAAQAAAGVWPLLALLADGANKPGRGELAAALGVDPPDAVAAAHEILAVLGSSEAVSAALGVWARADLPLHRAWLDRIPAGTAAALEPDLAAAQQKLDAWARLHTGGLIGQMPIRLTPEDLLVLASALLVRTEWVEQFSPDRMSGNDDGPWHSRAFDSLRRTTRDLSRVKVARTAAGELTAAYVSGTHEIDVVLVLGEPDASAGEVLEHGVRLVAGEYRTVPGTAFAEDAPGPGITRSTVEAGTPGNRLRLELPAFSVSCTSDLLQTPEVFGLKAVTDAGRGHFPGVSPRPLAVSRAVQDITAAFTATGFEASAVTAFSMVAGARMPKTPHSVLETALVLDRPFGFIAVHRTSELVLVAGWVQNPGG
ncbi:MAG TPA: serpin family protein [Actinocrinis sp.]|nr:serpin family protein [Actinocrinis sp.]